MLAPARNPTRFLQARWIALAALLTLLCTPIAARAAGMPAACPPQPTRVVRSAGGTNDYLGTAPGVPDLCRVRHTDGEGEFYFGVWRADWPGAGLAYPALVTVIRGVKGTRASFITRAVPGLQWMDSFTNEGIEPMTVGDHTYQAVRVAHEREGIEGNFYHSVITSWRDIGTGVTLRTVEKQIAGTSYGPDTTWQAVRVEHLR